MNDLTNELSTVRQSASPESLIDRLFQKLAQMYGRSWLDMWAGVPMDGVKAEWARSLHGVSPEAMRMALEAMKTEGRAFPPNLAEFVALCRQFIRRGPHQLSLAAPRTEAPADAFKTLRSLLAQAKTRDAG